MFGQAAAASMGRGTFGRPGSYAAPGASKGQPQRMAFDTSGSQGGAGMGINMMNAQKNPWMTQMRNFGMMGPQQGYGQRYRGLGPSDEAMESWGAQSAGKQRGAFSPGMYGIGGGGKQMGQYPMNMQQPVGEPMGMGEDGVMQREQIMGLSPRRPMSYMYS